MDAGVRRWNWNIHYHRVPLDAIPDGAKTALDIGSGDGLLSFDLAASGLEVVGIDVDETSVERATGASECTDRTTFVHGDVFSHPFEPASFDLVASSAMLHHVDAVDGLRRMAELVRPGGVVAIVGFATESGPVDHVLAGLGRVARIAAELTGRHWGHHAPICWPPPLSIDEMRSLVERELPGATFRRRVSNRYSVVWRRPIAETER